MNPKKKRLAACLFLIAVLLIPAGCASSGGGKTAGKKIPDEKNPRYQCEKGAIALKYGLTDEAIRYGELAVSLDPNYFEAWMLLGSARYSKGQYDSSADAYRQAASLKPGSVEARKFLGLALLESKELGQAEAEFKKALELGTDIEALFQLGKLLHSQAREEEALQYAEKAIRKSGDNPALYNLKGVILNQLGRYPEAIGSFQAGLVLNKEDVGLLVNLGIAYLNNDEKEKGREALEKALPKIQDAVLKARIQNYLDSIK